MCVGKCVVEVEMARELARQLRAVSANPVVYAELPGGQHAFDLFHSLRFDTVINGIEAFADLVRTRASQALPDPSSHVGR